MTFDPLGAFQLLDLNSILSVMTLCILGKSHRG